MVVPGAAAICCGVVCICGCPGMPCQVVGTCMPMLSINKTKTSLHEPQKSQRNLPHVRLLITSKLPISVTLHALQKLALHLCCRGEALRIPITQLLAVSTVGELCTSEGLENNGCRR